jgi:hypothetical protein
MRRERSSRSKLGLGECLGLVVVLHLCALKMRMAQSLFADENAPDWAFSKRKGLTNNTPIFYSK